MDRHTDATWLTSIHFTLARPNATHTHTQMFNGLFSRTTWVGRYQKDKPFWILLKQERMGWQWHQPNHMQIICTSLRADDHPRQNIITPYFLQAGCPSCHPTNSVKALKAIYVISHSEDCNSSHTDYIFNNVHNILQAK